MTEKGSVYSSSETVAKQDVILTLVLEKWVKPRIFSGTGAGQHMWKLLSNNFLTTNKKLFVINS